MCIFILSNALAPLNSSFSCFPPSYSLPAPLCLYITICLVIYIRIFLIFLQVSSAENVFRVPLSPASVWGGGERKEEGEAEDIKEPRPGSLLGWAHIVRSGSNVPYEPCWSHTRFVAVGLLCALVDRVNDASRGECKSTGSRSFYLLITLPAAFPHT